MTSASQNKASQTKIRSPKQTYQPAGGRGSMISAGSCWISVYLWCTSLAKSNTARSLHLQELTP